MRVGYVALIGRPNSWKSSFVNTLLDEKVSIVSPRPQSTHKIIRGIYTDAQTQIIFFDTPGVHESQWEWNIRLNDRAKRSIREADVVVRFIDASRSYGSEERTIEDFLEKTNKPVITVLSKVDSIRQEYASTPADAKISIFDKQGYSDLIGKIQSLLPEGPQLYEEDQYTDQDYETRISEIVREKVFDHLKEELPYAVFVEVEEIEDSPTLMRILATLYVERDSQKSILIGAAGAMITRIGTEARTELERIFDRKMFLKLRVKTLPKWRKNEQQVKKALGNERLIS